MSAIEGRLRAAADEHFKRVQEAKEALATPAARVRVRAALAREAFLFRDGASSHCEMYSSRGGGGMHGSGTAAYRAYRAAAAAYGFESDFDAYDEGPWYQGAWHDMRHGTDGSHGGKGHPRGRGGSGGKGRGGGARAYDFHTGW